MPLYKVFLEAHDWDAREFEAIDKEDADSQASEWLSRHTPLGYHTTWEIGDIELIEANPQDDFPTSHEAQ